MGGEDISLENRDVLDFNSQKLFQVTLTLKQIKMALKHSNGHQKIIQRTNLMV
jgi:hypothetical protein